MPQKRKKPVVLGYEGRGQPYLYLREGLKRKDGTPRQADWVIRHKSKQIGTGCSRDEAEQALERLDEYKASIYEPIDELGLPASRVLIADVLSRYLDKKAKTVARPRPLAQRIAKLAAFWGDKTLSQITERNVDAYVESRTTTTAALRELQDLQAAVRAAHRSNMTRDLIIFEKPSPPRSRDRWLTRQEAAKLIRTALFKTETYKGHKTQKRVGRHLAKFILVALRTGTRASAICEASFERLPGHSYVELTHKDGKPAAKFYRLADGKTEYSNKRYPPVWVPDKLALHLHRWRKNGQRFLIEWNGKPVLSTKKSFERAARECGFKDVCRHTLRHTAATWMMQSGKVSVFEGAGYLGMSVKIFADRYAHHSADHQSKARAALN